MIEAKKHFEKGKKLIPDNGELITEAKAKVFLFKDNSIFIINKDGETTWLAWENKRSKA